MSDRKLSIDWMQQIQDKLQQIQYGSIQIIVHNGQIVQLECTEKIRVNEANPSGMR